MKSNLFSRPRWITRDLGNPTGKGVPIGILDSGWEINSICASTKTGLSFVDVDGKTVLPPSLDSQDHIGHGTACIDILSRIAPGATCHPMRIFGKRLETSLQVLLAALRHAIDNHLSIVNLSLGTLRLDFCDIIYQICEEARRAGVIIVAANYNGSEWSIPACFDSVISVGCGNVSSPYDYIYQRDNAIECLAMGTYVGIRWLGDTLVSISGNSFAAPAITGLIALFLERYPKASLEDIRDLLEQFSEISVKAYSQ